jgi:hypothetical protein
MLNCLVHIVVGRLLRGNQSQWLVCVQYTLNKAQTRSPPPLLTLATQSTDTLTVAATDSCHGTMARVRAVHSQQSTHTLTTTATDSRHTKHRHAHRRRH